jgi:oxygen-independent coproporphyrinogen-3 oxidase
MKLAARREPVAAYLETLLAEIDLVAAALPGRMRIGHLHWGGGTPTALWPEDLARAMDRLRARFDVAEGAEIAIESDPRTLTPEMAAMVGSLGFTRASFGVQEFDPRVQAAINRVQPPEMVAQAVNALRAAGVAAVNFDLIYGLPHQTVGSCVETVQTAAAMRPERFAVFGYAHIPSFKKRQRLIDENALPGAHERNEQAQAIAETLMAAGYRQIGLDHFALPDDDLALASDSGQLHRNFQGYTTDACKTLIGFGASAIGRFAEGYVQNEVPLGLYARRIAEGGLATTKGYALTPEDRLRGDVIERLMCDFSADIGALSAHHGFAPDMLLAGNAMLRQLQDDGIVTLDGGILRVDEANRFVIRAVASAFDAYLAQSHRSFSKAA